MARNHAVMTRDAAWELLTEYTKSESLLRHALAVEASMREYARIFGEDEERWGIVGLLHDFDYERWPEPPDHPLKGAAILEELGYPEDVIYAIKSHADYLELPRVDNMSKALYAVDEMSGFVMAVALVRPSRSVHDVKVSSVKKKMKDKAFAQGHRQRHAAGRCGGSGCGAGPTYRHGHRRAAKSCGSTRTGGTPRVVALATTACLRSFCRPCI